MADKRITGPIQVLVIGFDKPDFGGQVPVPDVVGLEAAAAIQSLTQVGLEPAPEAGASGTIPAGQEQLITSAQGRIRYDVSFSADQPAGGDNSTWCDSMKSIGLMP